MKILSLFDGMSCGAIAFREMGIDVERYVAYEIDKYAVQVSARNFPNIEQKGDVFAADFTEYEGFDAVIGGSPCTYWSIAQKNNRETEASGLGWELFSQYVRALHEAKPKYFLYENNKSMSKEIKASITEAFGFEPVLINSALMSAQNRQRLYWVGIRQEDGTYCKADIEQPEDKCILLRDVLDSAYPYRQTETEKGYCLDANYWKTPGSPETFLNGGHARANRTMVAEPVCLRYERTEEAKAVRKQYEAGDLKHGFHELHELHPRTDGKTNTLSTVLKDNQICEPVRVGTMPQLSGVLKDNQATRIYSTEGKDVTQSAQGGGWGAKTGLYACPVLQVSEATKKGFTEIIAGTKQ